MEWQQLLDGLLTPGASITLSSGALILLLRKRLGLFLVKLLKRLSTVILTYSETWLEKKLGTIKESIGTPVPTERFNKLPRFQREEIEEMEFEDREGYEKLAKVLKDAYDQSPVGKGKERHARQGQPIEDQQILHGQRKYGMGYALGQADKKMEEALNMENWSSARRDLLGAIVYVAAAIIYGDEMNPDPTVEESLLEVLPDEDDELVVNPPVNV